MSVTNMEFKTEMKQLMDIIIHSLYSHREIFFRELISNSCDAIDKVRFDSLTKPGLLEDNSDWKIMLTADKENKTLTISDNGIGMTKDEIIEHLGTIAKSGTKAFVEQLKNADLTDRPDLIGQFGVGFYSSFMVADNVTVISRAGGSGNAATKWVSDGAGSFSVEDVEKERRGTDIILHLKDDAGEYLDDWKIKQIVKKYSDFIEHPITMNVEKEEDEKKIIEEETLNSQKALWLKSKSDITEDEYNKFYQQVSSDFQPPAKVIHYIAEGTLEFRALLFLPEKKPMFFADEPDKYGPHLYIKRVSIMDHCKDLLPPYLRFVQGIVDSSDLPLNVSREMFQHNPVITKIQKSLVSRVLKTLAEMQKGNYEEYVNFYKEFSSIIKMGIHSDYANKEKIADLLLFDSSKTKSGEFVSLKKYIEQMPDDQEDIYYLIGEDRVTLECSPYIEIFKSRDQEVLFMTDPVDEWVVQSLLEHAGKKLKAIDKGEIKDSKSDEEKEQSEKKFEGLVSFLNDKIADVKEVRLSSRLKKSAACLVVEESEMGAHMEKLMKQLGRETGGGAKKILELNAEHPSVEAVLSLFEKDATDPRIEDYGMLFYDQAVIAEGSAVKDPAEFARRINKLLVNDASKTA